MTAAIGFTRMFIPRPLQYRLLWIFDRNCLHALIKEELRVAARMLVPH